MAPLYIICSSQSNGWLRTGHAADCEPVVLVADIRPGVDAATAEVQVVGIVTTASRRRPIAAVAATSVRLGTIPVPGANKVVRESTPFNRLSRTRGASLVLTSTTHYSV